MVGRIQRVQVFDDGGDAAELRFFKQLFGLRPGDPLPKVMIETWEVKVTATERNPCAQLPRLPESFLIPKGSKRHVKVFALQSWEDCVKSTVEQQREKDEKGEVCAYVSEPNELEKRAGFEQQLRDMIDEANGCFRHNGKRVQITVSKRHSVVVNPRSKSILLPLDSHGVPVHIWECRYYVADCNSDGTPLPITAKKPIDRSSVLT
jgi:hypothetical protein